MVTKNSIPSLGPSMASQGRIPPEEKKQAAEEKRPVDLSQLAEVVTDQQNTVKGFRNVNLNFAVYEASGEIMVTVVDQDTGKVIREIPAKEALDLAAKLQEVVGLIFDKEA
jgi:flagellar protein FlaG